MDNRNKIINDIKNEYAPKERTKLDELRETDSKVKTPVNVFAYLFGTVAALILGTGMCLSMKVIGAAIPALFYVGIVVGIVGIALCAANYFIYKAMLDKRKKKYAPQILALSDELLNGEND